jgi:transcriptional regulator NrdR family protein
MRRGCQHCWSASVTTEVHHEINTSVVPSTDQRCRISRARLRRRESVSLATPHHHLDAEQKLRPQPQGGRQKKYNTHYHESESVRLGLSRPL